MTSIQRKHNFYNLFFSLSGVCSVCKKEVIARGAFSSIQISSSNLTNHYLHITNHVLKELLEHRCPGPAMEVPRSYDGIIEMQSKARSSPE